MNSYEAKWCSVWSNAVSISNNKPESYGRDLTLRYPALCPFAGSALKFTFDNYTGTEPVRIARACFSLNGDFYDILFDGSPSCVIPAGEEIVSDPAEADIPAGSRLEVSFYLADFTLMRASVYVSGPLSGGSYALGDRTHDPEFDINISRKTNNVYFLTGISLLTSPENHAVLCYGDSITAQDWPDYLQLRCGSLGIGNTSVIRKATSGSRILREYSCITYESYGLKGTRRFPHEVPQDGTDTIILQQGINDIIHPVGTDVNPFRPMSDLPTADELISGFTWYIDRSRSLGLKVYAGTLLPIRGWRTYAPFREELRCAFNEFLRTTPLLDGCIDFDLALRSPSDPTAFLPFYDSGDHLHPSAAGYQAMAEAVPEALLH